MSAEFMGASKEVLALASIRDNVLGFKTPRTGFFCAYLASDWGQQGVIYPRHWQRQAPLDPRMKLFTVVSCNSAQP